MKKLLLCLLLLSGFMAGAQVYNNEWIDYGKTYYKFKIGKNGPVRIPQSALAAAGIGSAQAQHFQLWRNGAQVPLYTSVATGTLSASDFIEFWGEMNDGRVDNPLYLRPEYQLSEKWNLLTDTASYFLTVNTTGTNVRLATTVNNVAGNTLPAEPYFMFTAGQHFRNKIHNGRGEAVGEYLFSSAYDRSEGFTSVDIHKFQSISFSLPNLFVYPGGPNPHVKTAISGVDINKRNYKLTINGDSVIGNTIMFNFYINDSADFPLSKITSNTANITIYNNTVCGVPPGDTCLPVDRMVVHRAEITYPRQFNFGGASNFEFNLPASATGNYLEISNFTYSAGAPVLYDLTNNKRYVADISNASLLKFALEPSANARRLVLFSQAGSNITAVTAMTTRNFVNLQSTANQSDYIIVTNPVLHAGPNGTNPVEAYRSYRASTNGGSYNAKVYYVDELVDQFAFGIKLHPLGLRNFFMYAHDNFSVTPRFAFLLGHGMHYVAQRNNEAAPITYQLNLVPTFGYPASDVLLTAAPGDVYPRIPVGRLSAINGQEILTYLKKVQDFESQQRFSSPLIKDKAWMKNVVHAVGASEPGLQRQLDLAMSSYGRVISDTLFGGNVTTFTKSSPEATEQINNGELTRLMEEGLTLITYFGHSSATTLEFNMNSPESYNNKGKYPMFMALGCNAGNFFVLSQARLNTHETLSERWVLAQERGTIGFIASSHFGVVHFLDKYAREWYESISYQNYGQPIGVIMQQAIGDLNAIYPNDFYIRAQCEETILHGDPAVTLNPHAKPDYVIEQPLARVNPTFISIADNTFTLDARFLNIGRAINRNIVVEVKREYPNKTTAVIFRDTIPGIRYIDSLRVEIPIDPLRDKGSNKLTITVDADNYVDELYETNNSITKEVFIYEDEARPIYPYNFSIVSRQDIKLVASTANPLSKMKTYRMELDTTEHFNSPIKVTSQLDAIGGILEFNPGLTFRDSVVYYWRVALIPASGQINWNTNSFIYLNNHPAGFNQSHVFQHFKSGYNLLQLDSASRSFMFDSTKNTLFIRNAIFPTAATQQSDFTVSVNNVAYIGGGCTSNSIIFNVFDPVLFKPLRNASGTDYGSALATCSDRKEYNFEFSMGTIASRRRAYDFLQAMPAGSIIVARGNVRSTTNTYAAEWKTDEATWGAGNSLYHIFVNNGFSSIDSFSRPRAWSFIFKKDGINNYPPQFQFSDGIYDKIILNVNVPIPSTHGVKTSPLIGPAKAWKQFQWNGRSPDPTMNDEASVDVIGITRSGDRDTLFHNIDLTQPSFDISSINAQTYPFLQLSMETSDTVHMTPYQLRYWRITYDPMPEGAIATHQFFSLPDSVEVAQPATIRIGFKNVSDVNFDSLKLRLVLTDRNNVQHILIEERRKPLVVNDTIQLEYVLNNPAFSGLNLIHLEFNPDNDQLEQYHFNNFIFHSLYVRADTLNPFLDVTFDNVHIVNKDIVSSRPDILIKLKDEARWLRLNDTSLVTITVTFPDNTVRRYKFDNDTLRFIPAEVSPTQENTATVNLKPYFDQDGEYILTVSGKDRSENPAGNIDYKVAFQVYNKPMISNLLNYPNPFTTSTAFVFTLTGSEIPQNLRIQILTITGKVVREITKEELGPLRIGRNITEFKWDGTDQYGQKLANGVYLYRVITNLNGKSLDKFRASNDNTDKYFNKGYGKMYLMR